MIKAYFIIFIIAGLVRPANAEQPVLKFPVDSLTLFVPHNAEFPIQLDSAERKHFRSRKIIASVLAFPLPFGLLGLHRVVLGTKPYVPFVYISTVGGCFGILPLIDFLLIATSSEERFEQYYNNPRVFMWAK